MSWDAKVCWDAAKAAGMLRQAQVVPTEGDAVSLWVGFVSPDVILGARAGDPIGLSETSRQYEIEWWADDLPTIVEGDQVLINDILYKVRETPYIPLTCSGGEFRRVTISRVR